MNAQYKIEKINPGEISDIARLHAVCFNGRDNVDFFKWKYFENPAGDAFCLAVKDSGNIVGSCVMIPEEFYVFGERKKIYKCCDLMIHPKYRRQGLSTRLAFSLNECLKKEGPLFLYTLCGKNATPTFLKNKWTKFCDVDIYFKHRKQLSVKFFFEKIKRLFNNNTLRHISSVSGLCKDYRFSSDDAKIRIAKDERYLGWRLRDPRYTYKIIGYYDNDVLKGYISYNAGINDVLYIVDLDSGGGDAKIIEALVSAAELDAHKSGHRLVIALAFKDSIFQKTIKRNNYLRNPFGRGPLKSTMDFNILVEETHDKKIFNKSNWDVYSINYDDI
ncbi:GNAT family N-acetyltransferase [Candidatus Omnitrophota bacterium]